VSSAFVARPARRTVLFATATLVAVALVALAAKPLIVLFGGFLFALVLRGLADGLSRVSRLRYGASFAVVLVVLVALGALAIVAMGPRLQDQLTDLVTRLPEATSDLLRRLRHDPIGRTLAPSSSSTRSYAETIATNAASAVGTTLEVLGGLVIIFFVGVYGAARPDDYANAVLAVTPRPYEERVRSILAEVSSKLTRWLLGRLVAMIFVGVTCSIAFAVLGVPLALTLGLVAGLLTFIEYVGAVASAVPVLLLALTKSTTTALAVLVVYTVLHVIEGYVLTPLLAKASVRFPPALTLAGQVIFATLVGPIGLTFSTPILVLVTVAVQTWQRDGARRAGEGP
jgi:predicted PurR-regulated permease PerM